MALLGLGHMLRDLYKPARASMLEHAVQLTAQVRGQAAGVHPLAELRGLQLHGAPLRRVAAAFEQGQAPCWPAGAAASSSPGASLFSRFPLRTGVPMCPAGNAPTAKRHAPCD